MGTGVKRTSVKDKYGFTIIEVLIVLAVTGLLMLSVSLVINGKQQRSEFQSALSDLRGQIQQVGNEVANGSYPDVTYGCSVPGAGPGPISLTAATNSGGQCVYIGKVLHFYGQGGAGDDSYSIYSMLGDRNATNYSAARLALAAKSDPISLQNPDVELTKTAKLEYGLTVKKFSYTVDGVSGSAGSVAFVQSISNGTQGLSNGSGTSQFARVMVLKAGSLAQNQQREAYSINDALSHNQYDTDGGVSICFKSGSTNQYAVMSIANGASQLDVSVTITRTSCE